jgi:hypothetical protein
MHPRTFDYWHKQTPLSLYRQIHKLEAWARTIGFESATDIRVQKSLREFERWKKAAARAIEETKQKEAERTREEQEMRENGERIAEEIRKAMSEVGKGAQPD